MLICLLPRDEQQQNDLVCCNFFFLKERCATTKMNNAKRWSQRLQATAAKIQYCSAVSGWQPNRLLGTAVNLVHLNQRHAYWVE